MAEVAVTCLLQQVKEVIKGYKDFISGAEKEFYQLNDDLAQLKAILKDMENKPREDNLIKEIEKQIRVVVYEVEDTIDACLTHAAAAKGKIALRSFFGRKQFDLAKEVRSLRQEKVKLMLEKAEMMYEKSQIAHGPGGTSAEETAKKMKKDQAIRQEKVVSLEDEEEIIIDYLMEPMEELDVLSIVGMPGLGKTTLAWKIFHSEEISYAFPIRIWVYVSQEFNCRDVFLKILKTFTNQDVSSLSDQHLGQAVRAYLEEERFLLVLDDVWSADAWDAMKDVLPNRNGMGKVLITCRNMNVGTHASLTRNPHVPRFLTQEESWELLQLEVFGDLESCPQNLKHIGEYTAGKCDGVPLRIVVIGRILKDRVMKKKAVGLVEKEWMKISENVNLALEIDEEKVISDLIALSYDSLPDDLRVCFLYLGVFPEDYEIQAWTLTRLWVAEGFMQPQEDKSLEEIAEEHLDDLISRNLLMVTKINNMGEAKVCRVHDMIRAFCKSRAAEQNLFQEIKMSEEGLLDASVSMIEKFHRICLHSNLSAFLSAGLNCPRVRSFLCFRKEPVDLDPTYVSVISDAFESLRVLNSNSIKFHQFPTRVTKLIHLRYITLCIDDLKMLPEQISELWNLQTLVVDTKSRSITVEANIWRMIRLRHLKTKAAIILNINWEGEAGENLQTLSRLSPESCTGAISERAYNLKTLGIRGKLSTLFQTVSLEKLLRLEKLKLFNDLLYGSASEDRLHGLPKWNCFPPNLRRLTLSNTFLDWKHMYTLARIDNLEVLKLKDNAFTGVSWDAIDHAFTSLQFLLIANTDLVLWEASTNTFPSLRCLVLKNCENLKEIPGCLCLAKGLENLDIERVRKSAADSARKIEEAKRQEDDPKKGRWGVKFKLSIGPGCDRA